MLSLYLNAEELTAPCQTSENQAMNFVHDDQPASFFARYRHVSSIHPAVIFLMLLSEICSAFIPCRRDIISLMFRPGRYNVCDRN